MVEDMNAQAMCINTVANLLQSRIISNRCNAVFAVFRQLTACKQISDKGIEQPVVNQERLGSGEMLRRITSHTPQRGNGKSSDKTRQVQRTPCLKPSNRGHTAVEQGKISKQHQIIAAAV